MNSGATWAAPSSSSWGVTSRAESSTRSNCFSYSSRQSSAASFTARRMSATGADTSAASSWRAKISSSGTSLRSYIFIMEHTSQILGQGVPHGEDLLVFELIAHLVADKPGADVHDGLQRGQVVLP